MHIPLPRAASRARLSERRGADNTRAPALDLAAGRMHTPGKGQGGDEKLDPSRRSLMIAGAALAATPLAAIETAHANVKTGLIDYAADLPLEGYLAYDESIQGKRPGVLVAHTQRGIQEFVREQTRELGKLGYVALAADFYGKGIRPLEDEPAGVQSRKIKGDRALTRRRIQAGYDVLRAHPLVADGQIAIIGYCVGGLVASTRALRHAGAGDRRIPRHAESQRRKTPRTSRAVFSPARRR